MGDFHIQWVGTPNYTPGRQGRKPIAIVNHITAGLYPGTLNWMQNTQAKTSSHYLITKTGEILQLVKDEDTVWANGVVNETNWSLYDGSNPNRYTISIEHEALAGEALTTVQYEASLYLHRELIKRWNIPIDEEHIIGHYRIDSVNRPNCPGDKFPWKQLFTDLKQPEKEKWKLDLMEEARKMGLITGVHQPDEIAPKWFVLAVVQRILNKK